MKKVIFLWLLIFAFAAAFAQPFNPCKSCSAALSGTFWKTTGNSGTTAGTNFIGTTDSVGIRMEAHAVSGRGALIYGTSEDDDAVRIQGITNGAFVDGVSIAGRASDGNSADIAFYPANGKFKISGIGAQDGYVLVTNALEFATWQPPTAIDFSSIPAYANNAAAFAAIGAGKFYYTDVAGEYIVKVSHTP